MISMRQNMNLLRSHTLYPRLLNCINSEKHGYIVNFVTVRAVLHYFSLKQLTKQTTILLKEKLSRATMPLRFWLKNLANIALFREYKLEQKPNKSALKVIHLQTKTIISISSPSSTHPRKGCTFVLPEDCSFVIPPTLICKLTYDERCSMNMNGCVHQNEKLYPKFPGIWKPYVSSGVRP